MPKNLEDASLHPQNPLPLPPPPIVNTEGLNTPSVLPSPQDLPKETGFVEAFRQEPRIKNILEQFKASLLTLKLLETLSGFEKELLGYMNAIPAYKLDLSDKSILAANSALQYAQQIRNRTSAVLTELYQHEEAVRKTYHPIKSWLLMQPEISGLKNQNLQMAAVEGVLVEMYDVVTQLARIIKTAQLVVDNIKAIENNLRLQQESLKLVLYYLRA